MDITTFKDPNSMRDIIQVGVDDSERHSLHEPIQRRVIELVAQQMAKDILENNYVEIMEKISPEAIANMAIAEAGAAINETLHKKLPEKILEIEKRVPETVVLQRGLLGGVKRIK